MKKWSILNQNDGNDIFEVEAETQNDACVEALSQLGWSVCADPVKAAVDESKRVMSAFILHDNGTWEQPSFVVPAWAKDDKIEMVLRMKYGGFMVTGLADDSEAPESSVADLTDEFFNQCSEVTK